LSRQKPGRFDIFPVYINYIIIKPASLFHREFSTLSTGFSTEEIGKTTGKSGIFPGENKNLHSFAHSCGDFFGLQNNGQ